MKNVRGGQVQFIERTEIIDHRWLLGVCECVLFFFFSFAVFGAEDMSHLLSEQRCRVINLPAPSLGGSLLAGLAVSVDCPGVVKAPVQVGGGESGMRGGGGGDGHAKKGS